MELRHALWLLVLLVTGLQAEEIRHIRLEHGHALIIEHERA